MENQVNFAVAGSAFETGRRIISTDKKSGLETTVIKNPRLIVYHGNDKELFKVTISVRKDGTKKPVPDKVEYIKKSTLVETVRFFKQDEGELYAKFLKHHPMMDDATEGDFEALRNKAGETATEKVGAEYKKSDLNLRSFTATKRVDLTVKRKAVAQFAYDERQREKAELAAIRERSKANSAKK